VNYLLTEKGENPYKDEKNGFIHFIPYAMQLFFRKFEETIGENKRFYHMKPLRSFEGTKLFHVVLLNVAKSSGKNVHYDITGITDDDECITWQIFRKEIAACYRKGMNLSIAAKYDDRNNGVYLVKTKEENFTFPFDEFFAKEEIPFRDGARQYTIKVLDLAKFTTSYDRTCYDMFGLTGDDKWVKWTVYGDDVPYLVGDDIKVRA